ncbi:MAG TPA: RNA polymerase sigma-70 factor [Bacteroidales bacterium]|nr:RNA polymerase sigma-70 factor [Bacteroidales bacterium]
MKNETYFRTKFEELFREHFTGLCYFARKYTGDPDSSKEIVHTVFLRIWESRAEFEWDLPAKSYLFTSVYNRSMNYIRDNKKFISHDEAARHKLVVDDSLFSDNLETAELECRIKLVLQKLPERCREVFELSRFEGKKYAEIAEQLNISVKTVETQMSKALGILKAELKDYLTAVILILLLNMHHG